MNDNELKTIKIASVLLIISLSIFIVNKIVIFLNNGNPEKQLNNLIISVGGTYYENILYDNYKDDKTYFKDLEKNGLTVDLKTSIQKIGYNSNKFVNDKTGEKCDLVESNFIIYPKKPYGKKDYIIKPNLSCGYGGV